MTSGELDVTALRRSLSELEEGSPAAESNRAQPVIEALLAALEAGQIRAAAPDESGVWRVESWVKQAILLAFRLSDLKLFPAAGPLEFYDKSWLSPRSMQGLVQHRVRLVPGGSAVRRGAHLGAGVILMPPCYVNVGSWIDSGTMIDSHVLVGSCAQIGAGVHLSAGVQIGGVLEPPGAMPVIVEDRAFVGALCAVLEGVHLSRGAVIGAGVVLTRTTPVFDLVEERTIVADSSGVLTIPENAVVISGTRPVRSEWGRSRGLAGNAALIVKRRDAGTDARAALEEALR